MNTYTSKERNMYLLGLAESPASDFTFATAPEFEKYRFGMFFLISVPAAISCVLSIIPMRKYEISNESHKKMLAELNMKRNETV